MNFLDYQIDSGKNNMRIDSELLKVMQNKSLTPTLRLYGWKEATLSLGKNQPISQHIQNFCQSHSIPIVRRPTGGRALLHDKELTYCFVCPKKFLKNGDSIIESYKEISQGLIEGFKEIDITLEFPEYKKISVKSGYCMGLSTGADLSYQGKKLIGSAQYRNKDCILQHGSILIDYNKSLLEELFAEPLDSMISLKEIILNAPENKVLCEALKRGFQRLFE